MDRKLLYLVLKLMMTNSRSSFTVTLLVNSGSCILDLRPFLICYIILVIVSLISLKEIVELKYTVLEQIKYL